MDSIKNIDDVKRFFRYLYEERNVAFHPDDSFDSYVKWNVGTLTFTTSECKEFDRLMNECFKVCEETNVDIYELACNLRDHFVITQ